MSSGRNGTLYTGVTSNLARRVCEHEKSLIKGFTAKYVVHQLVYYEIFETALTAISREKQLKNWKRNWKLQLIEKLNPQWKDLYVEALTKETTLTSLDPGAEAGTTKGR